MKFLFSFKEERVRKEGMIGFCPLASGSKGNAIYVGTAQTKILIDAGITAKTLINRLGSIGVTLDQIDAVLITHEHTDHIKGLSSLTSATNIPVFCNSDTAKGIYDLMGPFKFKIFSTGETFEFGDLEIHPFSIPHDTRDPVAFTINMERAKIGFCTDLGFVTPLVKQALKNCKCLVVEANHKPSMVHASSRPRIYKERVLGRQGHLSNEECAHLIAEVYHEGLTHIHLAHLSSECNAPEVALQTVQEKLLELGANVDISIAFQDRVSRPVYLQRQDMPIEDHLNRTI